MWNHYFWRMIVVAGVLFAILLIGAVGALAMKTINWTLREIVADKKYSNSILDKLDMGMFLFTKSCVRFYVKSAQWVGSLIILLLIVGGLGRLAIFTATHWREIWGP